MKITILKKNLAGEVIWQYEGRVIRYQPNAVVLEALFNHLDMPFSDVILRQNDRFVETFFTNRWYNIFEIHDRDDDRIKGWYCDICKPAVLEGSQVSYVDLALDLWISTDGRPTIMDEGDFEKLELDDDTRQNALAGLDELMQTLNSNKPPE